MDFATARIPIRIFLEAYCGTSRWAAVEALLRSATGLRYRIFRVPPFCEIGSSRKFES
jgi:hypothetical protein